MLPHCNPSNLACALLVKGNSAHGRWVQHLQSSASCLLPPRGFTAVLPLSIIWPVVVVLSRNSYERLRLGAKWACGFNTRRLSQELEGFFFFGWLVGFVSFFTPFNKDNSSWKCFLEVSPWCFSSFAGALSGGWVGRVFPPPQGNKAPTELRF